MHTKPVNRFVDADVLVVGPAVHACVAALEAARGGLRVALVMNTASVAVEIGSSMGAWLTADEAEALPGDLRDALLAGADEAADDGGARTRLLDQTRAIVAVEDLLLDTGVELFYDAFPIGMLATGSPRHGRAADGAGSGAAAGLRAAGALFGGKFGVAAAAARLVVDCTADAALVRTAGAARWTTHPRAIALSCLVDAAAWWGPIAFCDGVTVCSRGQLVEFRAAGAGATPLELRRVIARRMSEWNREHPDRRFVIERSADEALVEPGMRLESDGFAGEELTGVERLVCIGPAADATAVGTPYLDARTRYVEAAGRAAARGAAELVAARAPASRAAESEPRTTVPARQTAASARGSAGTAAATAGGPLVLLQPDPGSAATVDPAALRFADPSFDEPNVDLIEVAIPRIPVASESDVAVVGGGTSGAVAAWQAATLGLRTLCLEKHADLGGVSTIGGVPAYWYGRRTPYFKRFHRLLKDRVRSLELPVAGTLLHLVEQAGADVRLRTPTVGVAVEGSRLTHAVSVTPDGLVAFGASAFIDASGDGDLAAWAGAPYSYGSERDEITLWCSFGTFHHGRHEASRQYMSVVDQRSIHDTARGIVAARRMGGIFGRGRYVQHYIASRESRHIRGRKTVTYHDVMMGRAFPDTVLTCKSNVDIKGMASSRAAMCGFVERSFLQNFVAGIPFGALVPQGLPNLLVVGKAYSITHDGLAMARMQPDMMSLGAVAAIAASHALGVDGPRGSFSAIDVGALQQRLIEAGCLLPGDLPIGDLDERVPPDDESLAELVERLTVQPYEPSEWARILSRPDEARSIIGRRDVVTAEWVFPQIDRLTATLGDPSANDRLLAALDQLLFGDTLPGTGDLERRHDAPDHGYAPEPVYLINALAWTGDERLVERLERVAARVTVDPAVSDHRFSYVHSIAYAAELLGLPAAGAVAEELMNRPAIAERLVTGRDERLTSDYTGERWAYLGLCLARAAARSGFRSGYERLADYLGDQRLYLARSARAELAELLGADSGFDIDAWRTRIAAAVRAGTGSGLPGSGLPGSGLPSRPYRTVLS